jgi:hypothetical protein
MIELIGYAASALVAISLMMKSIVKLRWLNMAGAVVFCIYGLAIGAYPVFAMNLFIVFVNIYYLNGMRKTKDYFELLRLSDGRNAVLRRFLVYYRDDIQAHFPGFAIDQLEQPLIFFVLRNMNLAGLFAATVKEGILWVKLDYATPEYRDLNTARFFFGQLKQMLGQLGVQHVVAQSTVTKHVNYLCTIGFEMDESFGEDAYRLT